LGPDAVRSPRSTMALSPDGTRIVFVGRGPEPGTHQLFTRRLDEATATAIPGTQFGTSLSMPFFSPAGDWIGFLVANTIRKAPVQGGAAVPITDVPSSAGPLGASWGDDGNIVFAATSQTGLLRVSSSGGTPERLKKTEGVKFFPQVLPGARGILV